MSRSTKMGIALSSLAVLMSLMVVVLRWLIPIKPACLILLGASYDGNLTVPHLVDGWKSLHDLETLADKSGGISSWLPWAQSGKMRLEYGPHAVNTQSSWDKAWTQLCSSFAEKTALIVVSMHAGADDKAAFLLADDPRLAERIPLDKLFGDLDGPQFKGKNRVLILDVTRIQGHPQSGLLYNNFVNQLNSFKDKIDDQPGLVILCASDEKQKSWHSEEWRRTIFLHYVIEGLKGAADSDRNSRVSAGELFKYVQAKVKSWVRANKEDEQTPILLGGDDRADDIDLVQIQDSYTEQGPGEAPGASFMPPAELENAWRECQTLRETVPSPAVYSPHLWRRYQDTLLRYEQLIRAGDPTAKAADLRATLGRLGDSMLAANRVDQAALALGAAVPMNRVLGFKESWTAKDLKSQLDRLWDADPKERASAWAKVQSWAQSRGEGRDDRTHLQLVQTRLSGQLLRHLVAKENMTLKDLGPPDPSGDESRARAVLRLVEKLGGTRSAETHFLAMLLQDMDPKSDLKVEDVQRALNTRLAAEETVLNAQLDPALHPYSEVIFPWLKTRVDAADKDRRAGEDFLFATSKLDTAAARTQLEQARKKYTETRPDADLLRQAFDTRDRVLADLPYYALWVARQQTYPDKEQQIQALVAKVEELSKQVHALSDRLRKCVGLDIKEPPIDDDNREGKSLKDLLKDSLEKIDKAYSDRDDGLQVAFKKVCASLDAVHTQRRWHEIEDALAIPLTEDAAGRMKLIRNSRDFTNRLNSDAPKTAATPVDDKGRLREQTQRTQKLALAVLGPRHLRELRIDMAAEVSWVESATRVGPEIGKFWQQLPDAINKDLFSSLASSDLKKAEELLVEADLRSRLLPGSGVAFLTAAPYAAPEGLRRLHLHDLLVWQARRTLDDHWYMEDGKTPFYASTALAYLKSAKSLAESKSDDEDRTKKRQALAVKMEKETKPAGIKLANLSQPHWTSELSFPLRWKVEVEEGMPEGVPMIWFKVVPPMKAAETSDGRTPLKNWPPDPIGKGLVKSIDQAVTRGHSSLEGLYRGQRLHSPQDIQLYREPEIIAYAAPPPARSGVALRMDKDFTYGAVSIVLDTSGSMDYGYPDRKNSKEKRFDYARKALRTALEAIPDGTYLSLIAFRYDPKLNKSVPRVVQAPKLWKAAQFEDFMDRVDNLRPPIGGTPLAKSFVEARREGFPANYQGPKVILALTDGDDTESIEGIDPRTQREVYNAAVRKLLDSQFLDSGIEIQMVCFNNRFDDDKEAENAENQFKKSIDNMIPPGNFQVQPDGAQLAATLEQAIRPHLKLYQGSVPVKEFRPLPASLPGREIEWRTLKGGNFEGLVYRRFQNLYLESGDLLELTLKRQGNDITLERTLLGLESRSKLTHQEQGDWTASVLQNQIDQRTSSVQQLVAVEEKPAPFKAGNLLKQIHPGFTWLEVSPRGDKKPGQLRWYPEFTYAAPTFRLATKSWPSRDEQWVPAEVRLNWSPKTYPDSDAYTTFLEWSPKQHRNVKKVVGTASFTIESVDIEEHKVSETPWNGELTQKRCVVVRVAHDLNKPVWVQLRGDKGTPGEEHHYYTAVSKYTAYFWGLANPDLERLTLNVISVEDFKAATNGTTGAIFGLPPPTTTPGPQPVLKLILDR